MMSDQKYKDLSFISDELGRRMYYKFSPADNPADSPLLVILHGHTFSAKPSRYRNSDWNVLVPIDNYGVEQAGSWWLGEGGDFFVKSLLERLVQKTQEKIGSNRGLYFWGSSMGGYGALLHGILLGADAVYANIPQIKLLDTSYSASGMGKFFGPIFDKDLEFNDLTNLIDGNKKLPLFYIAQARFDHKNYLEEHALYFLDKCRHHDVNVHFEIAPIKGHKIIHSIDDCVQLMEAYTPKTAPKSISADLKTNISSATFDVYSKDLRSFFNENSIFIGKNIIENGLWSVASFPEFQLLDKINWKDNPFNNRTWIWYFQQLHFLPSLIAYDLHFTSCNGVNKAISIVKSWVDADDSGHQSDDAWHDHGTALRAKNILLLIEYLEKTNILSEDLIFLKTIITIHANKLLDESFYSKGTNHGLDQSLVLFQISSYLGDHPLCDKWRNESLERLRYELNNSFSSDGGHVENSPGYLVYGIKQYINVISTINDVDSKLANSFVEGNVIDKSCLALAFFVKPDGTLPLFGDTAKFTVTDFFGTFKPAAYDYFLYSIRKGSVGAIPECNDLILKDSGWAVFRSSWNRHDFNKHLHFVFKCGFLSTYHRHDDDTSFTLYAYGQDWFIDGGLYKHEPKDPMRVHFRSADCHNITSPNGIRAHRDRSYSNKTGIKDSGISNDISYVLGESHMFKGFTCSRKVVYNRLNETINFTDFCKPNSPLTIKAIKDKMSKEWVTYVTRFLIPLDIEVSIDGNKILLKGNDKTLLINAIDFKGKIYKSSGKKDPKIKGWTSQTANSYERATCLEFMHFEESVKFNFDISWINTAKNDHVINDFIFSASANNDFINVSTSLINASSKKLKYAFYLMNGDVKLEQIWYSSDFSARFDFKDSYKTLELSVICFIRTEAGVQLRKRVKVHLLGAI
ncbi:heparinase II/III family protein [Neptunomonas japonica]|uniref:Heparin-sulfate lyase N-terminal domain-containing protein n=1 Tax=Neptunomonas japonica JAMM 1380 TaxID=1441457 RepID=A0A7R6SWX3_9GAMM|nr:heparinase II/III family protein [Neptunomonas japonica]BBB30255.1 hypothetical protein NEJAP_2309 [Neptunomonas japonica JAMM 1380]